MQLAKERKKRLYKKCLCSVLNRAQVHSVLGSLFSQQLQRLIAAWTLLHLGSAVQKSYPWMCPEQYPCHRQSLVGISAERVVLLYRVWSWVPQHERCHLSRGRSHSWWLVARSPDSCFPCRHGEFNDLISTRYVFMCYYRKHCYSFKWKKKGRIEQLTTVSLMATNAMQLSQERTKDTLPKLSFGGRGRG